MRMPIILYPIYIIIKGIVSLFVSKEKLEKKAEEYKQKQIDKHNEKLEKINNYLKDIINQQNNKILANLNIKNIENLLIDNLSINQTYLIFLYYAITLNKANNYKEANELYEQNKNKIYDSIYEISEKKRNIIIADIQKKKGIAYKKNLNKNEEKYIKDNFFIIEELFSE